MGETVHGGYWVLVLMWTILFKKKINQEHATLEQKTMIMTRLKNHKQNKLHTFSLLCMMEEYHHPFLCILFCSFFVHNLQYATCVRRLYIAYDELINKKSMMDACLALSQILFFFFLLDW